MREHAQAAWEPAGEGSLALLPYCVSCPEEWGWPCDVELVHERLEWAVRSEHLDDATEARLLAALDRIR